MVKCLLYNKLQVFSCDVVIIHDTTSHRAVATVLHVHVLVHGDTSIERGTERGCAGMGLGCLGRDLQDLSFILVEGGEDVLEAGT